ncbi:MAG: CBASS oligonucleotide cyclase [Candidatus Obscuribacterales bacterium]|nr:CBASS oligonucleotide cyclase [Candidatus Obscuribacterales bacterium]
MPTTIIQGFSKLSSNLEITGLQGSTVSTRQTNVRAAVRNDLTTVDDFLTGSYQRNTMIAPLKTADVDIFVVLGVSYFEDFKRNQAGLLDKVKRSIKKTYSQTPEISRNGQAVTICFSDFTVDVVPAFNRSGGGYLIPNSVTSTWIETDPKQHISIWSSANSQHSGNLVPLIKMIKAWNKENGQSLNSFHLECLVLKVLTGVKMGSYPQTCLYVFDKMRDLIDLKNSDPAGYGGDVGAYLNSSTKRDDVKARLTLAYNRASAAIDYESRGSTYNAYDRWRLVFGDYFPAYG